MYKKLAAAMMNRPPVIMSKPGKKVSVSGMQSANIRASTNAPTKTMSQSVPKPMGSPMITTNATMAAAARMLAVPKEMPS
jgi:hypothetical protein